MAFAITVDLADYCFELHELTERTAVCPVCGNEKLVDARLHTTRRLTLGEWKELKELSDTLTNAKYDIEADIRVSPDIR